MRVAYQQPLRGIRSTGRPGCNVNLARTRCQAPGSVGGRQLMVTLKRPMGMVLMESERGVCVEKVVPESHADKAGIQAGDILEEVSAVVLKAGKDGEFEKEGYGQRPYDNWNKIMFKCAGESFDSVMAAIGSNNERWGFFTVDLVIRRPGAGASL